MLQLQYRSDLWLHPDAARAAGNQGLKFLRWCQDLPYKSHQHGNLLFILQPKARAFELSTAKTKHDALDVFEFSCHADEDYIYNRGVIDRVLQAIAMRSGSRQVFSLAEKPIDTFLEVRCAALRNYVK